MALTICSLKIIFGANKEFKRIVVGSSRVDRRDREIGVEECRVLKKPTK